MKKTLRTLVKRLEEPQMLNAGVIPWGAPVPSFGDLETATVATLGLNPSNREFVDEVGIELDGSNRRFHTLRSLGLKRWSEAEAHHFQKISKSCRRYFFSNPYDGWFKSLDQIVAGTRTSYYAQTSAACHLDLIPYATSKKWTDLSSKQRATLLEFASDTLGMLLQESSIKILILNGTSVIDNLQRVSSTQFERKQVRSWTLPRSSGEGVAGYAYVGHITEVSGIPLKRSLKVIGYNHNIQSSFGVTNKVKQSIQQWIANKVSDTDI